jgi:hypothetical protein
MPILRPRKCTGTAVIQACSTWVADLMAQGWDAYLATFTFDEIPGSMHARVAQMHRDVTAVYSRLATRMVRKPRSAKWAPLLPRGLFAPDLPVPKRRTTPVQEPPTNDGLHFQGVFVANRWGRLVDPLDFHFKQKQATYVTGKLRPIDVRRIDGNPEYVTEYALKGLKRFDTDHLLVLPRCLGELPVKIRGGS